MPATVESSVLGQCPQCGRLVTLPGEVGKRTVACPVCRHEDRGSAFGSLEPPLPVTVAAHGATRPTPSSAPPPRPRQGEDENDARTHLLLDVPMDDERSPGSEPPACAPDRAMEEERTHLLLDVPCLDDEDRAAGEARQARRRSTGAKPTQTGDAAATAGDAAEARTHLLLDPSDLVDADESIAALPTPSSHGMSARGQAAPAAGAAPGDGTPTRRMPGAASVPSRSEPRAVARAGASPLTPALVRLATQLDEALHGRARWALLALAGMVGFGAPALDYLASGGHSTLGTFNLLAVLLGLLGLGGARGRELIGDEEPRGLPLIVPRLAAELSLLRDSFDRFAQSPPHLKLAVSAHALGGVALGTLVWSAILSAARLALGFHWLTALPTVGGGLLAVAVAVAARAARLAPRPSFSLAESGDSLEAAAELFPIVDLSEPLGERFTGGTTALHRTVLALSHWPERRWPDRATYTAALQRHLQRSLPTSRIERERWLGRARKDGVIDLVVDGVIAIAIQRGFRGAEADAAIARVQRYAQIWSSKPMMLVVFETSFSALMDSPKADALAALHDEIGMLTVRMPSGSSIQTG